jgi:hypothetical protein
VFYEAHCGCPVGPHKGLLFLSLHVEAVSLFPGVNLFSLQIPSVTTPLVFILFYGYIFGPSGPSSGRAGAVSVIFTYGYASDTAPVWPEYGPEGLKHVAII